MNNKANSPSKIRLLSAILLIGVFAAGTAAGLGISKWYEHSPPPKHRRGSDHIMGTPGHIPGLKLSKEQKAKADAIREKYRPELEAIVKETFPRVRAINLKMEAEFTKMLDPEQMEIHNHFKKSLPLKHKGPPGKRR